jgi:hypothetical protein
MIPKHLIAGLLVALLATLGRAEEKPKLPEGSPPRLVRKSWARVRTAHHRWASAKVSNRFANSTVHSYFTEFWLTLF